MSIILKELLLDDAVLSDANVASAGGGLPRRIVKDPGLPDPIIAYQFNENVGATRAVDTQQPGTKDMIIYHTTVAGNAGVSGNCLTSNGSSAMCYYGGAGSTDPGYANPYSISYWLSGSDKTAAQPRLIYCQYTYYNGDSGIGSWMDGTNWSIYHAGSPGSYRQGIVAFTGAAGWTHFCSVYEGGAGVGQFRAYIDGVQQTVTMIGNGNNAIYYPQFPLTIGSDTSLWQTFWPAGFAMDMFALWTGSALSSDQVALLYTGQEQYINGGLYVNSGTAEWTIPQVSGSPVMVGVPGAMGRTTTTTPTTFTISFDSGLTSASFEPDIDFGLQPQTGNALVKITLTNDTTFIGGASGEGPVAALSGADTPVPIFIVSASSSMNGNQQGIILTLNQTVSSSFVSITSGLPPAPQIITVTSSGTEAMVSMSLFIEAPFPPDASGTNFPPPFPVAGMVEYELSPNQPGGSAEYAKPPEPTGGSSMYDDSPPIIGGSSTYPGPPKPPGGSATEV